MRNCVMILVFSLCLFSGLTLAQDSPKHKGVVLYEGGKYKEAAATLKTAVKDRVHRNDPILWNHLGLSYVKIDNTKEAVKAFEKAIDLDPKNSVYFQNASYAHLMNGKIKTALSTVEKAIEADPTAAGAYFLRGTLWLRLNDLDKGVADANKAVALEPTFHGGYQLQAELLLAALAEKAVDFSDIRTHSAYLKSAKELLEIGIKNTAGSAGSDALKRQLDAILPFYEMALKPQPVIPRPEPLPPGDKNYLITSKPKPPFTDAARDRGVTGRVLLLVTLGADAKIGRILVVKGLPHGLTEQAVSAARKITFTPRIENGVPKSVVVMLDYGFHIG